MLFWQDPPNNLKLKLVAAYKGKSDAEREKFPHFQKLCQEYSRGEFILHRWEQGLKWVKLHEEGLVLLVLVTYFFGVLPPFFSHFFSDCASQTTPQPEA